MFGFGDKPIEGICVGIDKVEIIAKGVVDLCHFLALDYMKNTTITIIVVRHVDDPIWVFLHG